MEVSVPCDLNKWAPVCAAIARLLSPHGEVVLHDPRTNRILAIWNALSGRTVGDPSLLGELDGLPKAGGDVYGPYPKLLADGRRLSSVSAVVRDPHGRAEVVLCINVNRTAFDDAARVLVGFAAPAEGRPGPLFEPDWRESVNDIVGGYVRESGVTVDRFSREDRLTMLSRLDAAGVFSRQRSVPAVAQALRVSRSMTYQLLAHLRRGVRTDADAS